MSLKQKMRRWASAPRNRVNRSSRPRFMLDALEDRTLLSASLPSDLPAGLVDSLNYAHTLANFSLPSAANTSIGQSNSATSVLNSHIYTGGPQTFLTSSTANTATVSDPASIPVAPQYLILPSGITNQGVNPNGGQGPGGGLTPQQVWGAYGIDSIKFNGIEGDGTGQTIAIVDVGDHTSFVNSTDSNFNSSALHVFDQQFGLPDPPSFQKYHQDGTPGGTGIVNPGWALEIALDIEWAHALAPMASIVLVEANAATYTDLLTAAMSAATVLHVNEVSMSFSGALEINGYGSYESQFDSAYFAPALAADPGVTFTASTGDYGAATGLEYPAASPLVVAVGGTTLNMNGTTRTSETGWAGGGGGISTHYSAPGYQPKSVTGSTFRTTPDVSAVADPDTGVSVYDPYNGGWAVVGGTSVSCPCWAGMVAIANQGRALLGGNSLNGPQETLPGLYSAIDYKTYYNDITTGNNGYAAGTGFDYVTGIGSPMANNLLPYLSTYDLHFATVINVTSTTPDGSYGAGTNINVTVTFDEAVVVDGIPTITLNSTGIAKYVSGSGTNALTFNYLVKVGEKSHDLDASSATALSGMIKGTDGVFAHNTLPNPGAAGSLGANKNIEVGYAIDILTQPQSIAVDAGATATFTASASANPVPTAQWQVSTDNGSTWSNISGATSDTYTTAPATLSMNSYEYRVVYTNPQHTAISDAATLTVNSLIVSSPLDSPVVGAVTLRQALTYANTFKSGSATVTFDPKAFATSQTIQLQSALPSVTDTQAMIVILSPGASFLTLAGGGLGSDFNAFNVSTGANLAVIGITFQGFHTGMSGGGALRNWGTLTLNSDVISGNSSAGNGGGIYNLGTVNVTGTTFNQNLSGNGGAIFNATVGSTVGNVVVNQSTFSGNSAASYGGAIDNQGVMSLANLTLSGNTALDYGGAILTEGTGQLTIQDSTLSTNVARRYNGGGVYLANGLLVASNSTFFNNLASAGSGDQLWLQNGTATLSNDTLYDTLGSKNPVKNFSSTFSLSGSIVARQSEAKGSDILGAVTDGGNNLISGGAVGLTNAVHGNLVGTPTSPINPLISVLGSYGGATQTLALLPGSPAINAGSVNQGGVDQRGVSRSQGGTSDIGAFESQGFAVTSTGGSGQSSTTGQAFSNPLVVTVTANAAQEPVSGGLVVFSAPLTGASATLTGSPATIQATGTASVSAVANSIAGTYAVSATTVGSSAAATATLTNISPTLPTVVTQPSNVTVNLGATASFTAAAAGTPTPTTQWQVSTNGGVTWSNITGATSNAYTTLATVLTDNGSQFRAVFSNAVGIVISSAATLTVNSAPVITTQPVSVVVKVGQTASFSAAATGTPAPSIQWQISTNSGQTWSNINGANSTTYTTAPATTLDSGNSFRAVFTNLAGTITTGTALLTVNSLLVTTTSDSPVPGQTTLRQALAYANTLSDGSPVISFDFTVFATNQTIKLLSALPTITDTQVQIVINGPTGSSLTLMGGGAGSNYNAFTINAGASVAISGISMQGFNSRVDGGAIWNQGTLALTGLSLSNNLTRFNGGAIYNNGTLVVSGLSFTNNQASMGGSIFNAQYSRLTGKVTVDTSTFTGNTAASYGGAIDNQGVMSLNNVVLSGNTALNYGGAILTEGTGQLTVQNSTITANVAQVYNGGGIYLANGLLVASNSTFFNNLASAGSGDQLWLQNGTATLSNDTLYDTLGSKNPVKNFSSTFSLSGSIVARQSEAKGSDILGAVTDGGNNLISGGAVGLTNAVHGNLVGTPTSPINPLISVLGSYGGATQTLALLPGSPAINAGSVNQGGVDQRGVSRSQGGTSDIGAFESQGFAVTSTGGSGQSSTTGQAFSNPLVVTVTANAAQEPVSGGLVVFSAPLTGASATLTGSPATIQATGTASVSAVANSIAGTYAVSATTVGSSAAATATLTNITPTLPVVIVQPTSVAVNAGAMASFTASATGTPTPTTQWQVSTNGGVTWSIIAGATSTTYTTAATAATDNGSLYRTVFTNVVGAAVSNPATLTVNTAPVITNLPVNLTLINGGTAAFYATAVGNPAPSVQWQLSTNSGQTWSSIVGANNPLYTFAATTSDSGKQFRAVFTNVAGTVVTTAALLTVQVQISVIPTGVSHAANATTVSAVNLSFSGGLLASSATNLGNYQAFSAGRRVAIKSVTYNASNNTITVKFAGTVTLKNGWDLRVSGLIDSRGLAVDGAHNGTPGSDVVASYKNRVFSI